MSLTSKDIFNQEDYNLLESFFNERMVNERTQSGYRNSLSLYVHYNKLHLKDLISEADNEEENGVRWKKSKLKTRLIGFRNWLQEKYNYSTVKIHFNKVKTFYNHFEIMIGFLPKINQKGVKKSEPITYEDIPSKELLRECVDKADPMIKAYILFATSSGCARREILNLTINDFIDATSEYHNGNSILECLTELIVRDDVIPTFRIKRQKTNKIYFTFCSPDAVKTICQYLLSSGRRFDKGYNHHLLFKTNLDKLNNCFTELNELTGAGQVAGMNRIRSHMFRKFHASRLYNDGLSIDKIDALQGRAKDNTHNSYFKESSEKLRELYLEHMDAILI